MPKTWVGLRAPDEVETSASLAAADTAEQARVKPTRDPSAETMHALLRRILDGAPEPHN